MNDLFIFSEMFSRVQLNEAWDINQWNTVAANVMSIVSIVLPKHVLNKKLDNKCFMTVMSYTTVPYAVKVYSERAR